MEPSPMLVQSIVKEEPAWDVHTHLYPPTFGMPFGGRSKSVDPTGLLLWGIDELLTYHYLVAEVFRVVPAGRLSYESFWSMPKKVQAEHIWDNLFIKRSPISEACRGVVTTLKRLRLDPSDRNLDGYRAWFAARDPNQHIDEVMDLARVSRITMTNNVFDRNERDRWLEDPKVGADPRFRGVLRIDPVLRDWPTARATLAALGYTVGDELDDGSIEEARRFLREWARRTQAIYCAVSLPPSFRYLGDDDQSVSSIALRKIVLPELAELGLPFAMMIGSEADANAHLRDAGWMVGHADVSSLTRLCASFPENRFLVTMLSRENQHELAVAARKFGNLMIFGCWWFTNTPTLVKEITQMRCELLGTSFIPQHSDARVLEQLIYKWDHSRTLIADVLAGKYDDLQAAGWTVSKDDVARDARRLFHGNFAEFLSTQR